MTPSEEVRKRLDELGIEHFDHGYENHVWWCGADNVGWHAENRPSVNGSYVKIEAVLTPAQAIAATVGRRDTMELWPEWEQVLFANVSDEVAQDNLNECVHELLEKAATVGRSCESCPEMDNPGSYIRHLQSALKWHDEHVPRSTNPCNTCVVLRGSKPPEEVLFVRDEGGVTHYLPESAGTCDGSFHKSSDLSSGRVPLYYCKNTNRSIFVEREAKVCPLCGGRIKEEAE